jgi:hypothetical protein
MSEKVGSLHQANYLIDKWYKLGYRNFDIRFVTNGIIVSTVRFT